MSAVNERFLRVVAERLGLRTRITRDREYETEGSRSERVVSTCLAAGATHYLSGPSAKAYLNERLFAEASIELEWMDYPVYREYAQPHGEFIKNLSISGRLVQLQAPGQTEYLTSDTCLCRCMKISIVTTIYKTEEFSFFGAIPSRSAWRALRDTGYHHYEIGDPRWGRIAGRLEAGGRRLEGA